jgi:hypothetical protein
MPRFRRARTPRVKVPKPAKIPRPKVRDLRMVLKGLMTVSVQNRIASLSYALQWYDQALPYLIQKNKLSADARKRLETAVKCRKQGMGTNQDQEKETAFLMAVRSYEKSCAALKPAPVDAVLTKFHARKDHLVKKQERMEQKFGTVTALLQKAIGDRVKLEVADAPKAMQYNPALTTLSYNREAAKQLSLKLRREGILSVFVDQLPELSRAGALESDGAGGWLYDPEKHVKMMEEMLNGFLQFARTGEAPKRLFRHGQVNPQNDSGPRPISAPRSFGRGSKGPKVGGRYVHGTAAAIIYERLQDEKEWSFVDLFAGLNHAHPIGPLKVLQRDGASAGTWLVSITNDTAQLRRTTPPLVQS